MVRQPSAEAIIVEGREALLGSRINVRISRRRIPVRAVETGAVDQELDRVGIDPARICRYAETRVDAKSRGNLDAGGPVMSSIYVEPS
jgi:hypothetical protein